MADFFWGGILPSVPGSGQSRAALQIFLMCVSDTGQGMAAEIVDHVFEPFFTTRPKGKGTGLGLAMVFGIVSQHNGYIWFSSEPDEGSCFYICLPRCTEKPKITKKSPHPGQPPKAKRESRTILIAEDNHMVRELAREALSRHGFRIIEAEDGKDALEKAKKTPGAD